MEKIIVNCPQCNAECEYSSRNPARPFCSSKCKELDFGDWANEKFTINTKQPSPDEVIH